MALLKDKFGFPLTSDYVFPSNTKISNNFSFNPQNGTLTINEADFRNFCLIINVDEGVVLYNPTTSVTNGTISGQTVSFNYNTSKMSELDKILVIYEYTSESNGVVLSCILSELQDMTKLLRKIYN